MAFNRPISRTNLVFILVSGGASRSSRVFAILFRVRRSGKPPAPLHGGSIELKTASINYGYCTKSVGDLMPARTCATQGLVIDYWMWRLHKYFLHGPAQ